MKTRKKTAIVLSIFILFCVFILQIFLRGGNFSSLIYELIFNKENIQLRNVNSNVNVLLLGIGGGKHAGPNLTDTIIFASISPGDKKLTLVSIPRDLWITDLDARINTAYAKGEAKKKQGGLILSKAVVKKVVDQPVDYAVVINFSGFVKIVDLLGGINVDVERSFDDFEYPVAGKEEDPCGNKEEDLEKLATASSQLEVFPCRYEKIHFDKGPTRMDGETALKYVRSRHGKGEEGTDFARSKRQERVISSVKDKALSLEILINPARVISLYSAVQESIHTDISQGEFDDFVKLAQQLNSAKIQSGILDAGDRDKGRKGLLKNPEISREYNFEWALIPRVGKDNFSEIHKYVKCLIESGSCEVI